MTDQKKLGDKPIEEGLRELMNGLAKGIDEILNAQNKPKRNGFVLMVFPFDNFDGRCNYISNANRDDIVILLQEQLARFKGQPELKGHA